MRSGRTTALFLDICAALSDPELSDDERGLVTLTIFYPGFPNMPPEQYQ